MQDGQARWRIEAIPILSDNYVWVLHDGQHAMLVDPGEAEPVRRWLSQQGLTPVTVLITHHHPDHIGGIDGLRLDWPAMTVIAPDEARIPFAHRRVGEGDQVEVDAFTITFDVLAVPGHTRSHIAYLSDDVLFCGDTLFSAGCGRLFEGTPAQMLASLQRLAQLPADTQVFCTHEYTQSNCTFALHVEPDNAELAAYASWVATQRRLGAPTLPSRIDRERAVNPFLRVDQPSVRRALHDHWGLASAASSEQAFATLRSWKDGFRG